MGYGEWRVEWVGELLGLHSSSQLPTYPLPYPLILHPDRQPHQNYPLKMNRMNTTSKTTTRWKRKSFVTAGKTWLVVSDGVGDGGVVRRGC